LLKRVLAYGEKTPGLLQHAIKKYAEAFEVIPRTLAETSGHDATEVLSRLYTAHHNSDDGVAGVDIEVFSIQVPSNFRMRKRGFWMRGRREYWIRCRLRVGLSSWPRMLL
jgi:chaperonin GroEL (HSP60 family)